MMINIHLFEYLSFCWFGEISTVSSVSTVYTVVMLWNQTLKWTNTTINWIYFISLEWIMCAKFTRVSRIAPNSPMYTHEPWKAHSTIPHKNQNTDYICFIWLYLFVRCILSLHLCLSGVLVSPILYFIWNSISAVSFFNFRFRRDHNAEINQWILQFRITAPIQCMKPSFSDILGE